MTRCVARGAALLRKGDVTGGIAEVRKTVDPNTVAPGIREMVPTGLAILADRQRRLNDLDGAEIILRACLAYSAENKGLNHPERALLLNELAVIRMERETGLEETERMLQEALAISVRLAGEEHIGSIAVATNLAQLLQREGRADEARKQVLQAADWAKRCEDPAAAFDVAYVALKLMVARGEYSQAERAALALLDKFNDPAHSAEDDTFQSSDVRAVLFDIYNKLGRPERAAAYRPATQATTAPVPATQASTQ
jgi:tetratricopeptide (TPR) repeat protein